MAKEYLDKTGLTYFWNKIKAYIDSHSSGGVTLDAVYPVGSIYLSVNNVNPSTLFGGTWVVWGSGCVPVGVDASDTDFATVEKTGGEKTHKLTAAESGLKGHGHGMTQPTVNGGTCDITSSGGHSHTVTMKYNDKQTAKGTDYARWVSGGSSSNTAEATIATNTGTHTHTVPNHTHAVSGGKVTDASGQDAANAHNNLQPYITCYMWKRTA